MRSRFTGAFTALIAILAISAVATTAAQAATEGPFYKISGKRLTEGESSTMTATSRSNYIITVAGVTLTCTKQSMAGAKILGSTGANGASSEETIEFSGCTASGAGTKCAVVGGKFTTTPLTGRLGYSTKTRTGGLLILLKPVSRQLFATIKFVAEPGGKCTFGSEWVLEGSAAVGVGSGGESIEPGKEAAEAVTNELRFQSPTSREIWLESAGALEMQRSGLKFDGFPVSIEGFSNVSLTGSPKWGIYTQ